MSLLGSSFHTWTGFSFTSGWFCTSSFSSYTSFFRIITTDFLNITFSTSPLSPSGDPLYSHACWIISITSLPRLLTCTGIGWRRRGRSAVAWGMDLASLTNEENGSINWWDSSTSRATKSRHIKRLRNTWRWVLLNNRDFLEYKKRKICTCWLIPFLFPL